MSVLVETAYFPPVPYIAKIVEADSVFIEAFESYKKQTIRNRCAIYGPNGIHILSIPVVKVNGNHTLTRDIRISDHQPWQRIHWRSIETAYNNSPFFLYYRDDIIRFYEKHFSFLIDLNSEILPYLLKTLRNERPVSYTEHFEVFPAGYSDFRNIFDTKYVSQTIHYPHYTQVFEPQHGFIGGLSILDILFNLGPESSNYLQNISK